MEKLGSQTVATLSEARRVFKNDLKALHAHFNQQPEEWQSSRQGANFQAWLDKIEAATVSLEAVTPEPEPAEPEATTEG